MKTKNMLKGFMMRNKIEHVLHRCEGLCYVNTESQPCTSSGLLKNWVSKIQTKW